MKLLKKADQVLNRVQNWILVITGTAITAMILVNAACRFLKIDWFGSEELTMFVAFWLYFVGAACASREDTHISADMLALFTEDPKARAVAGIVKNVISVVMCAVFTYWCFNYVSWQMNLGAKSSAYKLPVVISTIPILLSFALWVLYLVRDLARNIRGLTGGTQTEKGGESQC